MPPRSAGRSRCPRPRWRNGSSAPRGGSGTLATPLGDEPEAWSLAALTTLTLARRAEGVSVPLDEQDPAGWDEDLSAEGEGYLRRARSAVSPRRFQLEAAIQAVHCERRLTGTTSWASLRTLYAALLAADPAVAEFLRRRGDARTGSGPPSQHGTEHT